MDKPIFPVYEFRPFPDFFNGKFKRYADGKWIDDDGEYDLAFIGDSKDGFSSCLYVSLPFQKNIILSWLTQHWTGKDENHPTLNPWHYMLRDGANNWGGDWGRSYHPNTIAGDSGMDGMAKERRCCNGSHVEFNLDDKHIQAGLLRERDTKKIYQFPEKPICMFCGTHWTVPKQVESYMKVFDSFIGDLIGGKANG